MIRAVALLMISSGVMVLSFSSALSRNDMKSGRSVLLSSRLLINSLVIAIFAFLLRIRLEGRSLGHNGRRP